MRTISLAGMDVPKCVDEPMREQEEVLTYDDGYRDGVTMMLVVFLMILALAIGGGIDAGRIAF